MTLYRRGDACHPIRPACGRTAARLTTGVVVIVAFAACDDPFTPTQRVPEGATASRVPGGLTAPSGVSASAFSSTQIDITWQDNSQNESGFDVQRSPDPAGTFWPVGASAANAVTYRDGGLAPSTQYCYRVRAVRSSPGNTSFSAFSNTVCVTTPPPPPANASAAKAVASNATGVTLTWTDNSWNEDGFRIYSSSDGAVWSLAATVGPNTESWVTDQSACYRVVAFNVGGEGPTSNVACAIPAQATGAKAVPASPTSVTVSWTDASPNESGFRVYRSVDGTTWALAATVAANVTSWFTDQLACYRVVAFNGYGDAPASNVACAIPTAPFGVTATESGAASVTVAWLDQSANEDGFRVYRSSDGISGWALAVTLAPNTTSWVTNQVACYRVVTFNAAGEAPSPIACTMPAPPTGVNLVYLAPGEFGLSWTDNSAIEDGYQVIRIFNTWCPYGATVCNAGGTEPQWGEAVIATLPANSTSVSPLSLPDLLPVVDSYTECECVYVVATKTWNVVSAGLTLQRQSRRERMRP